MKVLSNKQIDQKINRLAYEILENNFKAKEVIFAGINNKGLAFAQLLEEVFSGISDVPSRVGHIRLNPAKPTSEPISFSCSGEKLNDRTVIIIDDVANTGRTIFYAVKPMLDVIVGKIEAAVLVDRKHKSFPIHVDYVGLSLATTLKEHIRVELKPRNKKAVFLE